MKGWSTANPTVGNEKSKLEDEIDVHKFNDGEWSQARPIGPIYSMVRYWLTLQIKDKKTKKSKIVTIPKYDIDYNPETEEFEGDKDPIRKAYESGKYSYKIKVGKNEQPAIRMEKRYFQNFIFRDEQENEPRKKSKPTKQELKKTTILGHKCHVKEKKSKTWTPIKAVPIAQSLGVKLKSLSELNTRKVKGKKKTFELNDPKYGRDINIKYDSTQQGSAMYDAQLAEKTELTEDELNYLIQDITKAHKPESPSEAKAEWKKLKPMIVPNPDGDDGDDDDDDDEPKKKKKSKSKDKDKKSDKKSKKKDEDLDDEDDDDDLDDIDDLDDDDDDDDEPKKKKKSKSKDKDKKKSKDKDKNKKKKSKKKSDDDDDDDLEDFDDDDEDEDEKPKKKAKAKSKDKDKKKK